MKYTAFECRLLSTSVVDLRSIHALIPINSFLLVAENSTVRTYAWLIRSLAEAHVGCFQLGWFSFEL